MTQRELFQPAPKPRETLDYAELIANAATCFLCECPLGEGTCSHCVGAREVDELDWGGETS